MNNRALWRPIALKGRNKDNHITYEYNTYS